MEKQIISLGWFCGTASSMNKHGYRTCTTPFDWCFSDFKGILQCIENDFEDFLSKENIEVLSTKPKEFIDRKYNIHFNHDIKNNFEDEYDKIMERYKKKIESFRSNSNKGVYYLRAVKDSQELQYIILNEDYINRIVKKYNKNNEIVFLLPQNLKLEQSINFKVFNLNTIYDGSSKESLRTMFDKNEDLINFLDGKYELLLKKDNIIFDLNNEISALSNARDKFNTLEEMINTDWTKINLPKKIIIYGFGVIGKYFYHLVKDLTEVVQFIDSNPTIDNYEGVPIFNNKNYINGDSKIIVSVPAYFNEIYYFLVNERNLISDNIISIESLYKHNSNNGKIKNIRSSQKA